MFLLREKESFDHEKVFANDGTIPLQTTDLLRLHILRRLVHKHFSFAYISDSLKGREYKRSNTSAFEWYFFHARSHFDASILQNGKFKLNDTTGSVSDGIQSVAESSFNATKIRGKKVDSYSSIDEYSSPRINKRAGRA